VIDLTLEPPGTGPGRAAPTASYRVAGVSVRCDRPIAALTPFERPAAPAPPVSAPAAPTLGPIPEAVSERFRAPAWLGGRWRPVACSAGPEGYRLEVDGVGRFALSPDGRSGRTAWLDPSATEDELEEAVLGPVLILALALHGVWCLHASAVLATNARGAVAFLGASGHGKSTLALALAEAGPSRWRHLADDVLPVAGSEAGAVVRPWFPQLKLGPERQPAAAEPEELPLRAVYLLGGPGGPQGGRSHLSEPSRRDATLALVRHTVASRLFSPALLARHLEACGALAAGVRVRGVAYPWTGRLADGLTELLAADLEAA